MLIQDITPAKTKWEKRYALMEYLRVGSFSNLFIDIKTEQQCFNCSRVTMIGKNTWYCSTECQDRGDYEQDNWRND